MNLHSTYKTDVIKTVIFSLGWYENNPKLKLFESKFKIVFCTKLPIQVCPEKQ